MRGSSWVFTVVVGVTAGCSGGVSIEGSLPSETQSRASVVEISGGRLVVGGAGDELVVDDAKVLVGEVELEGRTEASEVSFDAMVLEIGLAGEATPVDLDDVPARKYQEIGLELARGGQVDGLDHDFADGDSIVVNGTYAGEAFTFSSGWAPEIEFDISGLRVRDGEDAQITITFDVAAWFVDGDGGVLDPSDPDNADQIESNIASSIDAEIEEEGEDDDDD